MSKFNAIIDACQAEQVAPSAVRSRIEFIGAAGQTPQVYPYDAVQVQFTRLGAGQGAPDLLSAEPLQVLNGTVFDVHNQEPSGDWSVVNVTIEGIGPMLAAFPGDAVSATLTRLAAGAGAPPVTPLLTVP